MKRNDHVKAIVGLAATAFFLWLALRGVKWGEVLGHLADANLLYLGAAVLVSTLGMHVRAMRWKSLLAPVDPNVPFRARMAGTAVGFAANNLLPARVGEFARALVCARVARIKLSAVFGSLVIERLLDAIVCAAFLFGAMALPAFPRGEAVGGINPLHAARIVAAIAAFFVLLLVPMAFFPERAVSLGERLAVRLLPMRLRRPVVDALHAFLGGLGVLRDPKLLALALAWVVFQWLFLASSFHLAFLAFGITEPGFLGAVFLQSVISIAVSIPSAPGFFGTFEAGARYGLAPWGVDQARAVSFAIGFHLGGWLSVTALGVWYMARMRLSWRELRESEEEVEEAVESDPALQHPGHPRGDGRG